MIVFLALVDKKKECYALPAKCKKKREKRHGSSMAILVTCWNAVRLTHVAEMAAKVS